MQKMFVVTHSHHFYSDPRTIRGIALPPCNIYMEVADSLLAAKDFVSQQNYAEVLEWKPLSETHLLTFVRETFSSGATFWYTIQIAAYTPYTTKELA